MVHPTPLNHHHRTKLGIKAQLTGDGRGVMYFVEINGADKRGGQKMVLFKFQAGSNRHVFVNMVESDKSLLSYLIQR